MILVTTSNGQLNLQLGPLFGVSLTQMDGDGFTGYDHWGFRYGLKSQVKLTDRSKLSLELTITEKGASFAPQITPEDIDLGKDRTIELDFAEIPILYTYHFGMFYGELGVGISRLVNENLINESDPWNVRASRNWHEYFRDFEWNILLGGGLEVGKSIGFNFRTTIGASHIFSINSDEASLEDILSYDDKPILFMRNYLISLTAYYLF